MNSFAKAALLLLLFLPLFSIAYKESPSLTIFLTTCLIITTWIDDE